MPSDRSTNPGAKRRRLLGAALVASTCLAGAGLAYGQAGLFTYDPSQLPETKGTLKQYTLSPRGDVDGLILTDGTEVKVPPHLSSQIVFAIRPGDPVSVRGLKARALPLVSASQIRNDTSGVTVTDEGGPREREARGETLVTGRIAQALHGPRGETNGVLLDTGMTVRMPPHEADRWEASIQPGQTLSIRGVVTATLLGQVMEARAIGTSPEQMTYLSGPRGPKGPREARDERGPKHMREAREDRGGFWGAPPPPPMPGAPPPPAAGPGTPPPPQAPGPRP